MNSALYSADPIDPALRNSFLPTTPRIVLGMPDDREDSLYDAFRRLGIGYRTVEHDATFTAAQGAAIRATLPGGHSKSLLVSDKTDLFLLVALGTTRVDLKGLRSALGCGRLSFASPKTLKESLGLEPGSVTPFGLPWPGSDAIGCVVIDDALTRHDPIWAHPLRNTASTAIAPGALVRFCHAYSSTVRQLALAAPQEERI